MATNGEFLAENVGRFTGLTATEIASGRWLSDRRVDPGTYWMMIDASPAFDACYSTALGDYLPQCANGKSNVLTFAVPKPRTTYSTTVRRFEFLQEIDLTFTARPLGELRRYRLCWRNVRRAKKCVPRVIRGFDWDLSADDTVSVPTRNLPRVTTFTWEIAGRAVARRRVLVHR